MDPYSTSTGERESRSFREEPWHLHLHYVSSLSMHSALPTCQPPFMVRSLQLVEVRPYAEEEEQAVGDRGVGEFLQARQAPLYFSSTFTRFRDIVAFVLQHATFVHPTSSFPQNSPCLPVSR